MNIEAPLTTLNWPLQPTQLHVQQRDTLNFVGTSVFRLAIRDSYRSPLLPLSHGSPRQPSNIANSGRIKFQLVLYQATSRSVLAVTSM